MKLLDLFEKHVVGFTVIATILAVLIAVYLGIY